MAAAQAGNQSPATLMKQLDKTQQVKVQQYLFTILNQDQQQMLQKQMLLICQKWNTCQRHCYVI